MGTALAGNLTTQKCAVESGFDVTLWCCCRRLKIVNVWSHDGSPISPSPPTPPEKDVFLPQENIYAVIKTVGIGV